MREFIKTHPWRLEVVPVMVILLAAILPLLYRQEALADMRSWHGLTANQTWLISYSLRILVMVTFWIGMLQLNHLWPSTERRRKTFNYLTVMYAGLVALMGTTYIERLLGDEWFLIWQAVIVVSCVIQALLEYTRPSRSQQLPNGLQVD